MVKTITHPLIETHDSYPHHVASNPIYKYSWYAVREDDRNEVIIVDGRPGSCKSGWALRYGQDMDLRWDSEKKKWVSRFKLSHIVFTVQELVNLTTSNLPKGSVIIYDEAGVESDNTTYHELRSKVLRWVLQTWRYKNMILIITAPNLESVTVGIRRVATLRVETYGRKKGIRDKADSKIFFIQSGHSKGKPKVYEKYLRYDDFRDGMLVKKRLKSYRFPKPDPIIEWAYKKKKEKQTLEWYGLFSSEMKFMKGFLKSKGEKVEQEVNASAEELYLKYRQNLSDFLTGKGTFSSALIERKLVNEKIVLPTRSVAKLKQLLRADYDESDYGREIAHTQD